MKLSALVVATILLILPSPGLAQEIYGRIWVAPKKSAAVSATVTVACGSNFKRSARSDKRGLYRLNGPGGAVPCTVRVTYRGKPSSPVRLYLSKKRTKSNFELRARKGGRWSLIRR
jgi:hypothetical protein